MLMKVQFVIWYRLWAYEESYVGDLGEGVVQGDAYITVCFIYWKALVKKKMLEGKVIGLMESAVCDLVQITSI